MAMGDSLYACEPVFEICNKNKWKYLLRFKEGRIKTLWAEFQQLKKVEINKSENSSWIKEIGYGDRTVNIIETTSVVKEQEREFVFITDLNITKKNDKKTKKNNIMQVVLFFYSLFN